MLNNSRVSACTPTQLKIIADHQGLETMEAQEKPTFSTV